jgi:type VI secretion system protein ImpK
MNERFYQVYAESLVTAVQLTSGAPLPATPELRQRLIGSLDRMVSDGRRLGVADGDLAEARYALVAFIDEQILQSDWAGRAEWMSRPLQLELYRENTAGENFFVRLKALLRSGDRPVAVEAYYLCLVLGFSGAYRDAGDSTALDKFTRAARDQLRKALPAADKISPHAKPQGSTVAVKTGWGPLLGIVLGGLFLIALVVLGLGWAVSQRLREVTESLASAPLASAAGPRAATDLGSSPQRIP